MGNPWMFVTHSSPALLRRRAALAICLPLCSRTCRKAWQSGMHHVNKAHRVSTRCISSHATSAQQLLLQAVARPSPSAQARTDY